MNRLNADPKRNARTALRGYSYQIVRTIDAWLRLDDHEELYLEGAEDFDRVAGQDALLGQARNTARSGNITLRTKGVIDAINAFWRHQERNREFRLRYRYMTTSGIGIERDRSFGKAQSGLRLWSDIRAAPLTGRSLANAKRITDFLCEQPEILLEVKAFLESATPAGVIERLILPIEWSTGLGDSDDLVRTIKNALVLHGEKTGASPGDSHKVLDALYRRVFETASSEAAPPLTRTDFLRVFEDATSSQVPFSEQRAFRRARAPEDAVREAEARLRQHVVASNRSFSIFGVPRLLSMDKAWIDLPVIVATDAETGRPATTDAMLARYRDSGYPMADWAVPSIANISIGRFYRHCVVVGGPGLGKSMLIRKLALAYARDGFPVVRVDAKALALRRGGSFLENLLALGVRDCGVAPDMITPAFLASGVMLCDGLDETGDAQDRIARDLAAFAESHPGCRVIVTTRPVGYETPHLSGWRHYEILALDPFRVGDHVERLLAGIYPDAPAERLATQAFVERQFARNPGGSLLNRSPLLLGFGVLFGVDRIEFGDGRSDLYTRVFERIERAPNARVDARPFSSLAIRCVDVLGWVLTANPSARLTQVRAQCAEILADELGVSRLRAETGFEECVAFWRQTGLIEQVRHASEDMLLFVHKTLGEYAGARYLASLPAEARDAAILSGSQRAAFLEPLIFAGGLGLAVPVARALLTPAGEGIPHARRIGACVALLADSDGGLPTDLVEEILDAAFALLLSTPAAAGRILPVLLRATKPYPDAVARQAGVVRDDPRNWVRFAAWACLATAGPRHYDLDALVAMFLDLPALGMHPEDFGPPPGSTAYDDAQDLAIAFATAAFEEMLRDLPAERSNTLLATLLRKLSYKPAPPPIRFVRNATALLHSAGRGDDADGLLSRWGFLSLEQEKRYAKREEQMLKTILDVLADGAGERLIEEDGTEAGAPFLHFSAFLEATGFSFVLRNASKRWQKPGKREEMRAMVEALAALSGVDIAGLRTDARRLLAEIEAQPEAVLSRQSRLVRFIDIPPIDYAHVRMLDPVNGSGR